MSATITSPKRTTSFTFVSSFRLTGVEGAIADLVNVLDDFLVRIFLIVHVTVEGMQNGIADHSQKETAFARLTSNAQTRLFVANRFHADRIETN